MLACWREPTAKHAYVLSWFSVVVTFLCFVAGVLLYMVRTQHYIIVGVQDFLGGIFRVNYIWCPGISRKRN